MEREHETGLVELGTASLDTLGEPIGAPPETVGFYPLGLTDQ